MHETDNLQKNYFLHLIKGTSVILYIEDYHVSEIMNPPQPDFGIGLSSNYQRIRFYRIDRKKNQIDHERFIHVPYSDYYLINQNYIKNFKLPSF